LDPLSFSITDGNMMKTLTLAALTLALLMAAPAYAQDPLRNAYGGPGNIVTQVAGSGDVVTPVSVPAEGGQVESAGSATAPSSEGAAVARPATQASALSSLPFTGMDALLLLMGGTMLFAVGFGMRRLAR
jgi:hypothetical protein